MSHPYLRTEAAPRRPVKRLVAVIVVIMLCFCAICGKVLLDARRAAFDRAAAVATSLVATLNSDISRNIESYDLSLRAVIENLAYPETVTVSPELRQLILFDRSAAAKHLEAIVLLDANGVTRLDSRALFSKSVSRGERDYFKIHKQGVGSDLYVSEPFVTRETNTAVVMISRRLSNEDGSFAGVVAGAIKLSYFQQLFKNASLGANGNITLSRIDGKLVARWPYDETMLGRDLKGAELYKHLATEPRGQFETRSVTDGVHRLVVYSKVGDLPLVIGVGQSTRDIYAQWREYASTIVVVMLVLCAMGIALALYLAREMRRRNAAEATLAVLATMDELTGVANRRFFNAAIEREWGRAMREQVPLALVMCDSDRFKEYNDRHGHQTGDSLLRAIGAAMHERIRRSTDVAARYGGDEFAILLPGTSAEGAVQIAEQVRNRLAAVCEELGIPPSHLSFGVASIVPKPGVDQDALLAAADQALYRAKELGRNRIEVAPRHMPKPTLVVRHDAA